MQRRPQSLLSNLPLCVEFDQHSTTLPTRQRSEDQPIKNANVNDLTKKVKKRAGEKTNGERFQNFTKKKKDERQQTKRKLSNNLRTKEEKRKNNELHQTKIASSNKKTIQRSQVDDKEIERNETNLDSGTQRDSNTANNQNGNETTRESEPTYDIVSECSEKEPGKTLHTNYRPLNPAWPNLLDMQALEARFTTKGFFKSILLHNHSSLVILYFFFQKKKKKKG
ncbi:protein of unknown function DUF88 [Reticulomyxa filosa]|uniref:Uncharacterized protein n=1 Tax=Reticulomyxa filosa TaxID=46433 RepID=X6NMH4_RETFI|nr:protein of unknown function DUF88 [Reticulomyxa filosa]|eukprot:ETO27138.1 protein of unknown function DUF88 [Reticulomyxa filosa]